MLARKASPFETLWKLFCLTKKLQKNKNPCRIYRALSVLRKARQSAPLPDGPFLSAVGVES